jgi:hypothetical protein
MDTQKLGELETVSNTLRDSNEAIELIVGWVMVDGTPTQVAFTARELLRPSDRAKANTEDLPALAPKPPTHEELLELVEEKVKLEAELLALKGRGWLARLFNIGG